LTCDAGHGCSPEPDGGIAPLATSLKILCAQIFTEL
jgi:hypothetical protein